MEKSFRLIMRIFIVGGTGFLGFYSALEALRRGHRVSSLSIPDIELGDWFPEDVEVHYGDVFEMSSDRLVELLEGHDAMVYAVGPDDRITPKAPAYEFFHERLVAACTEVVEAARKVGVQRCVLLNSYFAHFDRVRPELKLAERHSYIKCRIEQAECVIKAGGESMAVMVMELPYIFGAMPERLPLWKNALFDRILGMRVVFFPGGGTNMTAVEHVAEAIVSAIERGQAGARYLIGDVNMSYKEMLRIVLDTMGRKRRPIITLPTMLANIVGRWMRRGEKKKGLESGLDLGYLFKDILSQKFYFNPTPSVIELGYGQGGVKEAIEATVRACYPAIKESTR